MDKKKTITQDQLLSENQRANNLYNKLQKKYFWSSFWYIFLNVFSFVLVATLIILNIFAIRLNEFSVPETKPLFIIAVIFNGTTAFFGTLIAFFGFKPKAKLIKRTLIEINEEEKKWNNREGKYKQKKDNLLFTETITKLIEKTL